MSLRERAGWLADSYFSSTAERYFTGSNKVEKVFLENYTLVGETRLPKGMIPMVYPADDYDNVFIPNWSLWYILEVEKYAKRYDDKKIISKSISIIKGLIDYFVKFENEFGLLEDLESWVFVEWSAANDYNHTRGVNLPTNALYALALEASANLLKDESLRKKAEVIRNYIKSHGYNGQFFVDNIVRNESNQLIQTNNITEVCQYYLFWTNCINKQEFKDLYELLMTKLGPYRTAQYSSIHEPNMMYGIYMRLDLLLREGKRKELLKECKHYFLKMAKTTNTLWENNEPSASCNHGFASYSIRWIIFALTGLDLLDDNNEINKDYIGISGHFNLPYNKNKQLNIIFDSKGVMYSK